MKQIASLLALVLVCGFAAAQSCSVTSSMTVQLTSAPILKGYVFATGCGTNTGEVDLKVSPGGTYTYQWSNNKTTQDIKNLVAGTYTVTVTNTSGCSRTASFVVASAFGTAPEPQYVRGLPGCSPSTGVDVRWEGPSTGFFELRYKLNTGTTWTNVGNVGNVESYFVSGLTPNKTYLFQVRYVCTDGKRSTYKGTTKKTGTCVTGNDPAMQLSAVEAADVSSVGTLQAFPNPASDKLTLLFQSDHDADSELVVTDLMGRTLYSVRQKTTAGHTLFDVDVSHFADGLYRAVLFSGDEAVSANFVIAH